MKLTHLAIEGFRSFTADQVLRFPAQPDALILVTGENKLEPALGANGAGKSTLWDAITWCLFGKTPRGLRAGSIRNWEGIHIPSVALFFQIGEEDCEITRTWSPNSLTLTQGDGDPKAVTQEQLEDFIGFDQTTFMSCCLMGQFNRFFFDLSPSEKLQLFSEALDLQFWLRASNEAKKMARDLDKEREELERGIVAKHASIDEMNKVIDQTMLASEQFEENKKREVLRREKTCDELEEALPQYEKELKEADEKFQGADHATGRFKKQLIQASDERTSLLSTLKDAQYALKDIQSQQRQLAKELAKFEATDGACPYCNQTVSEAHLTKEMATIEEKQNALFPKIKEAEKRINDQEEAITAAKQKEREISQRLTEVEDEKDKQNAIIRRCYSTQKSKQDEVTRARKDLENLKASKNPHSEKVKGFEEHVDELKQAAEEIQEALKGLRGDLDAAEYWVQGFKQLRLWLIEKALTELEIEVNSCLLQLGLDGWKVRFDVEKENKSGGVSKGFSVFITSPTSAEEVPWEAWSGGETQRLRIAGAVGFAALIKSRRRCNVNIEVWDEPTAHLSEEGIESLLSFFEARAVTQQHQIWLVDHRSLTAGNFTEEIRVVKYKDGSQIIQKKAGRVEGDV